MYLDNNGKKRGSSSGGSKGRAPNWSNDQDGVLISLLVEQFERNMCSNGTFNAQAWNYMVVEFNKSCKMNYDKHQLYNRWKTLKKLYILYA